MHGLLAYQAAFYRCVALVLKDDDRITRLTDEEMSQFELVFSLRRGSTDLKAPGEDVLKALGEKVIDKMDGKHLALVVVLIAAMFFGSEGFSKYLDVAAATKTEEIQSKKDTELHDILKELIKSDQKKTEILNKALDLSDKAVAVVGHSNEAYDSIVRHASEADEIVVQGVALDKKSVSSLNKITRRSSKNVTLKSRYIIDSVDTTDPAGFVVKLHEVGTDIVIKASLSDAVALEKFRKIMQTAEWQKKPIRVHMSARQVGDDIINAKILNVTYTRTSKK